MSSLNIANLRELADTENSCIFSCQKKIQVLVLPLYSNDMRKGIIAALDELTVGYCEELGGLMLGYENVKAVEGTGWLHSTNPYIHVHIEATFYIFAPTKGLRIKGVVNETSGNITSFLAYDKYNVVYHEGNIIYKLRSEGRLEAWQYLKRLELKEGDTCTLLLVDVGLRDFLPHLVGYPVMEGSSDSLLNPCPSDEEVSSQDSSSSKKRVRFSSVQHDDSEESASTRVEAMSPSALDTDSDEKPIVLPAVCAAGYDSSSSDDGSVATLALPPTTGKPIVNKTITVKQEKISPLRVTGAVASEYANNSNNSKYTSTGITMNGAGPRLSKKELQKLMKSGMLTPTSAADTPPVAALPVAAVKQEQHTDTDSDDKKRKKKKKKKDRTMSDGEQFIKKEKTSKKSPRLEVDDTMEKVKPKKKRKV